ncbi:hypothetical protein DFJ58DRAFT_717042 [Suillus subalutaceus]|uniref:uncharacterized protein n=1 Tax=Suillus subalutaceus TaxID=48586 RepID=UPI001B86FA57|nr:uncharacterized protein DFJ58DRAFT_717042 [Suillus subalutaceus]KAG1848763.1 hypothetical protein DFJ58DRAFT_717042 [Suillus subalutaceus]
MGEGAPPSEMQDELPSNEMQEEAPPYDGDVEMDYQPTLGGTYRDYHIQLDGHICDKVGNFIHPDAPPPPYTSRAPNDWTPYRNQLEFETAEFLYTKVQMSGGDIDKLMHLWGGTLAKHDDAPPFADRHDLYSTIDNTPVRDVPWKSFSMKYNANNHDTRNAESAPWMEKTYTTWFHDPHTIIQNMLANPDFKDEMDYVPYWEFNGEGDDVKCQWRNMMSGNWAWDQADEIAKDPLTHGATFIPVILRSDKMTMSVATGQNDYYPLYASNSNVHNNVHHAHQNAVAVVGFLAILKRPYIADYPEQSALACVIYNWCAKCFAFANNLDGLDCGLRRRETTDALCEEFDYGMLWEEWGIISDLVPFTNDFPCANIHELLSPDILHQIIKGTFKDHLVAWVELYLLKEHGKMRAKGILNDIDRWIAAAPSFVGLRRFPEGRRFSQWTGDDSKALMKFCSIVRQYIITEDTLEKLSDALWHFHQYQQIFQDTGVQFNGFSLPRQHSLNHYILLIHMFGALNGLCSSITESKHIKAIKEPWRCIAQNGDDTAQNANSNNNNNNAENDDESAGPRAQSDVKLAQRSHARNIRALAVEMDIPDLPQLLQLFLYDQLVADDSLTLDDVPLSACPQFEGPIKVFNSAAATFFAPSDLSSVGGMRREHIHAAPSWQRGPPHLDTVFINTASEDSINGMEVGHVLCFFSFYHSGEIFPCALIHWFKLIGDKPDLDIGMWMLSVIHLNTIICSSHLLPIFGDDFIEDDITFHNSLDLFKGFYVNKFVDHNSFEIAS